MQDTLTRVGIPQSTQELVITLSVPSWIPLNVSSCLPEYEHRLGRSLGIRVHTASAAAIDQSMFDRFMVVRIERRKMLSGSGKQQHSEAELTFTLRSRKQAERIKDGTPPQIQEALKMLTQYTYETGELFDCGEKVTLVLSKACKTLQPEEIFYLELA